MAIAIRRESRYLCLIRKFLGSRGHFSNLDILIYCRQFYPELSATTVHRVTSRMLRDGELALAPPTKDGCMRFDSNLLPHSHVECGKCSYIQDIHLLRPVDDMIRFSDDFQLDGTLVMKGVCKRCIIE